MKQQRIEVLLELISCNQPLFYWRYDEQGNLLYSDCPAEKCWISFFAGPAG